MQKLKKNNKDKEMSHNEANKFIDKFPLNNFIAFQYRNRAEPNRVEQRKAQRKKKHKNIGERYACTKRKSNE